MGNRDSGAALEWLEARASIGDLILIGSGDPIAWIIQRGTGSRFSHAAIVTDSGIVTEAYDTSLTINEDDEGLYHTSFECMLGRPSKLRTILILRPPSIDEDLLRAAAHRLCFHSPSYPTLGASLLSICRMFSETIPIPEERQGRRSNPVRWTHIKLDRFARAQVHFIGDGVRRVHCSESVVRLYRAAGVPIHLPSPILWRSMQRATDLNNICRNDTILPPNTATPGRWRGKSSDRRAVRILVNSYQIAEEVRLVIGCRRKEMHTAEPEDYVFPGDLESIKDFTPVCLFTPDLTPNRTRVITAKAISWPRKSAARQRERIRSLRRSTFG